MCSRHALSMAGYVFCCWLLLLLNALLLLGCVRQAQHLVWCDHKVDVTRLLQPIHRLRRGVKGAQHHKAQLAVRQGVACYNHAHCTASSPSSSHISTVRTALRVMPRVCMPELHVIDKHTWEAAQPEQAEQGAVPGPQVLAALHRGCCQLHTRRHFAAAGCWCLAVCFAELLQWRRD